MKSQRAALIERRRRRETFLISNTLESKIPCKRQLPLIHLFRFVTLRRPLIPSLNRSSRVPRDRSFRKLIRVLVFPPSPSPPIDIEFIFLVIGGERSAITVDKRRSHRTITRVRSEASRSPRVTLSWRRGIEGSVKYCRTVSRVNSRCLFLFRDLVKRRACLGQRRC